MLIKECIRYGSKLYCYDKVENVVYVYPEQKYDINEIPQIVLGKLIQNKMSITIKEVE